MFRAMVHRRYGGLIALALLASACGDDAPELSFVAVTFNSGTTLGMPHDDPPDDGYTSTNAETSDMWYGNGLAWVPVVDETRAFFAELSPDIVAFQEIFHPGECPSIPGDQYAGFVCDGWTDGDPTVVQTVVGAGYQVACHLDKPDKCIAVKRAFGSFRGCDGDVCLDGLDGARVMDCGGGSRIGRGVVDLVAGGSITVVNVHGSSGLASGDQDCRVKQFEQVFVDIGDGSGEPAANGAVNVVLGDLNTDPGRFVGTDDSADRFVDFVGDGLDFHFVSDVGVEAPPTYAGIVNIDHIVSDAYSGQCWSAGVTEGHPLVTETIYFDHTPLVCALDGPLP
jgi:hypothetical protein